MYVGPLEIVPGSSYVDSANNFVVAGEVTNHSGDWYTDIRIEVAFYDAQGSRLGIEETFIAPQTLPPGERGVFAVFSDAGGTPESVVAYTFFVKDALVTDEGPYDGLQATVLDEVAEPSERGTRYVIAGEVNNMGTMDCNSVAVAAGLYVAEGKLLAVIVIYVETGPLAAGQTGPFEVRTNVLDEPYAEYRLWPECYDF